MAIMVSSFRDSVSLWLDQVLPADIYTGSGPGEAPVFNDRHVQMVLGVSGVERVERSRQLSLLWVGDQPEVVLIARSIDWQQPQRSLPLVGILPAESDWQTDRISGTGDVVIRVFVSEAMVDLYKMFPGARAKLPLINPESGRAVEAWVAGVFRDYGRQHGAVVIDAEDYERLTGDRSKTGLSVWLQPGGSVDRVIAEIRALGDVFAQVRLISADALRALSLKIFDRSFALTYALELVALLIAVFAVASGFTAQVIVRRKEFALLAQLGQSLPQRLGLVAREAIALLVFAVAWGSLLGLAMSQILIHRVNPQSFHWTMETSLPWLALLILLVAVVLLGMAAAVVSTHRLLREGTLSPALREDW
jgi:putative ABC transport system permease protein